MKNIILATVLMCTAAIFGLQNAEAQQTKEHILLILKAQAEPQAASFIKFAGVDGDCNVKEGRNIIGTNTKTGDQIIVVLTGGRISQVGVQSKGKFSPIRTAATTCASPRCLEGAATCYTLPTGECFCLCPPIKKETPKGR
jgi:hypothetical protein